MVGKLDLAHLPPFDPLSEPSSLGQQWKNWIKRFQVYITAMNITDDKQRRALLLYQAGPATQEIFETLSDTGVDCKTAQELDMYFLPKKNVDYKIFQFDKPYNSPPKRSTSLLPDCGSWWPIVSFGTLTRSSNPPLFKTANPNASEGMHYENKLLPLITYWPKHAAWMQVNSKPLEQRKV